MANRATTCPLMQSAWLYSRFSHVGYSQRTKSHRVSSTESFRAHQYFFIIWATSRRFRSIRIFRASRSPSFASSKYLFSSSSDSGRGKEPVFSCREYSRVLIANQAANMGITSLTTVFAGARPFSASCHKSSPPFRITEGRAVGFQRFL